MIDAEARKKTCDLLSSLCAGIISNDEFEAGYPESLDRGVRAVERFASSLYHDTEKHYLSGAYATSSAERELCARCAMFLKSEIEYRWPCLLPWYDGILVSVALSFNSGSALVLA